MAHGDKFSRKQEGAIAALIQYPTILQAAEAAGISEKTLRVWIKEPAFAAAYREARKALVDDALKTLQRSAASAAIVLLKSLKADDDNTAIRAATAILDRCVRLGEALDLEERLCVLEAQMATGSEGINK